MRSAASVGAARRRRARRRRTCGARRENDRRKPFRPALLRRRAAAHVRAIADASSPRRAASRAARRRACRRAAPARTRGRVAQAQSAYALRLHCESPNDASAVDSFSLQLLCAGVAFGDVVEQAHRALERLCDRRCAILTIAADAGLLVLGRAHGQLAQPARLGVGRIELERLIELALGLECTCARASSVRPWRRCASAWRAMRAIASLPGACTGVGLRTSDDDHEDQQHEGDAAPPASSTNCCRGSSAGTALRAGSCCRPRRETPARRSARCRPARPSRGRSCAR